MSVSLALNLDQVKSLVGQCSIDEKIELVRLLEQETFGVRFNRLLARLQTDELSFEEITQEVETVRQKRYEQTNSSRY